MSDAKDKDEVIDFIIKLNQDIDKETYDKFKEMLNYHKPINKNELIKMIINKAYESHFIIFSLL